MKEDELAKTLKKVMDTVNTLNKNQQILVKTVDGMAQNAEVNKRVEEIIKDTNAATAAAAKAATPAPAPATPAPAPATPPPAAAPVTPPAKPTDPKGE